MTFDGVKHLKLLRIVMGIILTLKIKLTIGFTIELFLDICQNNLSI